MIEKIKNSVVLIIFVALFILGAIFYRSYKNTKAELKAQKVENTELRNECDSILSSPPDTTKQPIEIIRKQIVYKTVYISDVDSSGFTMYNDSIKNDSIDLNVTIRANQLFDISYAYRPIYKYQEVVIEKKVPQPVDVIHNVEVNTRGLFFNAGLGYSDEIAIKAGLMYLTRKNNTFNYDFVRYGEENIHIVSYGIKF